MEEDAHGIHAKTFCPAELLVDFLRIKALSLPHFEFVDSASRNKVAADQPGLLLIPAICL